jgi:radical SAM superfamily enzyme YgiQ (UPF0313 family)
MTHVLLVQLPIPRLNYGKKTGNIPLGAACIKQAAALVPDVTVDILPESVASYIGDAALIDLIAGMKPDILGFSLFTWNVERSLALAETIASRIGCRVVVGGPEVTPDNDLVRRDFIDAYVFGEGEQALDRKSTRLNSSHRLTSRMPSSA